jgi:hypothetical protein
MVIAEAIKINCTDISPEKNIHIIDPLRLEIVEKQWGAITPKIAIPLNTSI